MGTVTSKIIDVTDMLFVKDDRILLGYKKRGFGLGKYNGFGGKPQNSETILEAAIREAREESGLTVTACHKVAQIDFGISYRLRMHVFLATAWIGTVSESDEMRPRWFPIDKIPYGQMWKDDSYWLPLVIDGKNIKATFNYVKDDDVLGTGDNDIVSYEIEETSFR